MIPVSRIVQVSSSVFFFLVCGVVLARELSDGTAGVRFWCVFSLISIMADALVQGDDVIGAHFLPRSTDKGGLNRTSPDMRTAEYIISLQGCNSLPITYSDAN